MATDMTTPLKREQRPKDPHRAAIEDGVARMLTMAAQRRLRGEHEATERRQLANTEAGALEAEARRWGQLAQSLARTRRHEEAATENKSAAAE